MSDEKRALIGFFFGLAIMIVAVQIFHINSDDFEIYQSGTGQLIRGLNPWVGGTKVDGFFNPPFSVLFLWPVLILPQKLLLAAGGALLVTFVFYTKAWVALAWFGTNLLLWLFAAGSLDMFLMGGGLLLLIAGDRDIEGLRGLVLRVLAYGMLMVKPQGGLFIVAIFILLRRDWRGLLVSFLLYGALFTPFYGDWLRVILNDPPLSQTVLTQTIYAQFGLTIAVIIAILILIARRWEYWQLGGILAGILIPYGMVGIPTFLTLTAVKPLVAIPIVVIYSALLSMVTWVVPPPGVDYYAYVSPLLAIYHLGILGLAIVLACMSPADADVTGSIAVSDWIRCRLSHRLHLR
jgi:hypothetical protein